MDIYPKTSKEFQVQFVTEQDCINYLIQARWPDGYACPFCGAHETFWLTEKYLLKCRKCRKRYSLLSDTVFQGTHTPLLAWFRIMWHICLQKNGYSALSVQRSLGISYPTALAFSFESFVFMFILYHITHNNAMIKSKKYNYPPSPPPQRNFIFRLHLRRGFCYTFRRGRLDRVFAVMRLISGRVA